MIPQEKQETQVCLDRKWSLFRSSFYFIYKALAPKIEKKKESILKPNTILQNEDSSEKAKTQVY